jgi:hypothetical protein
MATSGGTARPLRFEGLNLPKVGGPMLLHQLLPRVDYLYCEECGHHVPCIRLEPGVWEVQCSRCVGQCGLCSCRSTGSCFGKEKSPVQTHMYVADFEKKG